MRYNTWGLCAVVAFMVAMPGSASAGGDLVTIIRNLKNVTTENFTPTSGSVLDGCITPGTHRVMRFDFASRNTGTDDVVAGTAPPIVCSVCPCATSPTIGNYEWSNAHCHWHLLGFNTYSVSLRSDANVKDGFKQAFCLMDYVKWNPAAPPGSYDCVNQGVTPGWEDVYSSDLPCQFINMDGVSNGDYRLVASTNVLGVVSEDNLRNNSLALPFRLSGDTVTPLSSTWSALDITPSGLDSSTSISDVKAVSPALHRWDAFGIQQNKIVHLTSVRDSIAAPAYLDAPAGTNLSGSFGVISRSPNTIDLFAAASNSLYWRTYNGTSWNAWTLVPTVSGVLYGISVVAQPASSNRFDAFYMDGNRNLGHAIYSAGSWTSENLGKPAASLLGVPAAVSTLPGVFDVFLQGGDSRLWQIHYQDGAWSGFQQFSSQILVGSPAAVVRTPGTMDVMWRDNNSRLAYMGWNGSQWSAVTRWSNISVASPPGLVAAGPDQLMAAVSGSDDRPYIVMLNGSTWSASLTSPTGFGGMHFRVPALVSWATNRVDLIYSLSLSRVGHLSWF